jgi:hypothetical protein
MQITAEVSADPQHGPVVTVRVGEVQVSVYLADETGIVTKPEGQHGIEVSGPWPAVRDQLGSLAGHDLYTCAECNGDGCSGSYYEDGSPRPCPDCRGNGLVEVSGE